MVQHAHCIDFTYIALFLFFPMDDGMGEGEEGVREDEFSSGSCMIQSVWHTSEKEEEGVKGG